MTRRLALLAVVATGACILATAPAGATPRHDSSRHKPHKPHPVPMIRVRRVVPGVGGHTLGATIEQSQNWAGYDATGGGFRSVTATWTQPSVTPDASQDTASCFWVGLDGDGSDTVEQCGTEADSVAGVATYYAWYEMYPDYQKVITGMTIHAGDVVTAAVTTDGGGDFTLTLLDHTTNVTWTRNETSSVATSSSAEVIAEAPTDGSTSQVMPLADFGTVSFTGCAFNGAPISAAALHQIDMVVDASGDTVVIASTSPLVDNGATFSVTTGTSASAAPPTLAAVFTPASGPVGTVVNLTGTGFSGVTDVSFDGMHAPFLAPNDTSITAYVPLGARTGPISVTTPLGTATSASAYTLTPLTATLALRLGGLRRGVLRRGKRVTARAGLTPSLLAGSRVRFTLQRRHNRHWYHVFTRNLTTGFGGVCSTTSRPGRTGTYRIRVTIARTAANTAAHSPWRKFVVR